MISCLICLTSIEFSSESSVCIPVCGHVFHQPCILRWFEMNVLKTCPKCRCEIENSNQLIKLYFGTSTNTEELNNEIDELNNESEICRRKMEFMLQEMNKNLKIIEKNSKEIAAKRAKMSQEENETENGAFQLKNLAVLLSRTDELKRIQDYYDSINN